MFKVCAVFICCVLASFCHAQKFGYYTLQISTDASTNNKVTYYVSRVVDVDKLDCSKISNSDPSGKPKSKLQVYEACIREWFIDELKAKGKWSAIETLALPAGAQVADALEVGGPNCKTGNEAGCFMNAETATRERSAAIQMYKKMERVIVEVD